MSFGTNTKPGFSVRDILDLPDSAGTEETEEEASAKNRGFTARDLRARAACCFGRCSRGAGDLHFSREETCFSNLLIDPEYDA